MKSEHQLRAEILATSKDLESARPGTDERKKALERLTALRRELGAIELQQLRREGK